MTGDLANLPKWARDGIYKLEREREEAVKCLDRFVNQQTPSGVSFEQHPSIGEGFSEKRIYLQTTSVRFEHMGVFLEVFLPRENDPQREKGIELTFGILKNTTGNEAAFVPHSRNCLSLVPIQNLNDIP